MYTLATLAFFINLDPHLAPFTSFWTSGQAAEAFWGLFAIALLALIVTQTLAGRRRHRPPTAKH